MDKTDQQAVVALVEQSARAAVARIGWMASSYADPYIPAIVGEIFTDLQRAGYEIRKRDDNDT
jgi:hypothetical protein